MGLLCKVMGGGTVFSILAYNFSHKFVKSALTTLFRCKLNNQGVGGGESIRGVGLGLIYRKEL